MQALAKAQLDGEVESLQPSLKTPVTYFADWSGDLEDLEQESPFESEQFRTRQGPQDRVCPAFKLLASLLRDRSKRKSVNSIIHRLQPGIVRSVRTPRTYVRVFGKWRGGINPLPICRVTTRFFLERMSAPHQYVHKPQFKPLNCNTNT